MSYVKFKYETAKNFTIYLEQGKHKLTSCCSLVQISNDNEKFTYTSTFRDVDAVWRSELGPVGGVGPGRTTTQQNDQDTRQIIIMYM